VVRPKPTELAAFGLRSGDLARFVELAFAGKTVATWYEDERTYDVVAKLPELYMSDRALLGATPIDVRGERFTDLASVAHLDATTGPNLINRENAERRIVVTANVSGRDLRGAARGGASPARRAPHAAGGALCAARR
jgi:Cu/Ag efflux pump CusA